MYIIFYLISLKIKERTVVRKALCQVFEDRGYFGLSVCDSHQNHQFGRMEKKENTFLLKDDSSKHIIKDSNRDW